MQHRPGRRPRPPVPGSDLGLNGEDTLHVTLGTGSTAPLTQIAFEVTVSSPYASTTFVLWTAAAPRRP